MIGEFFHRKNYYFSFFRNSIGMDENKYFKMYTLYNIFNSNITLELRIIADN